MSTIKRISKWQGWTLVALGLLAFALDGAVGASEAEKRAELKEIHAKLKEKERDLRLTFEVWGRRFALTERHRQKAEREGKPDKVKTYEQIAGFAAGRMLDFDEQLRKIEFAIKLVKQQLAALDNRTTDPEVLQDSGNSGRLADEKGNGF
jgi:hypothetical protein